ncbi:hypothetical protein [Streptomyces iakyrus]|uniref:hypothetical protein n=1 Tax=Streptomyces iakyrus TaxID=68219 RepID=UPI0033F3A609
MQAARRTGRVCASVKGYDLSLAAMSVAWLKGAGAADEESLDRVRALIAAGYRERNTEA